MSTPIRSSRIRILAARDACLQLHETARTRFRQTLQAAPDEAQSPDSAHEPSSPPPDHRASTSEGTDARDRNDIVRLQHAAALTMRCSGTSASTEDFGAATQHRIARAFVRQHRTETMIDSLVRSVAGFCRAPAIAQGGAWEIRIAIDPDVLPQTSLLLRLVAMQLQLRFECGDATSGRLLRARKEQLAEKLTVALREPYDLDIQIF